MSSISSALDALTKQHVLNVIQDAEVMVGMVMQQTVEETKNKYAALYSGNSPTPHQLSSPGTYETNTMHSGLSAFGMVSPMAAPQPSYFGQSTYAPFAAMYESSRILNLAASNLRIGHKVFWSSRPVQATAQSFMVDTLKKNAAAAGFTV